MQQLSENETYFQGSFTSLSRTCSARVPIRNVLNHLKMVSLICRLDQPEVEPL